jgi:hypothetical protein
MVITLRIDKIESGIYRAAVLFSGAEVTNPGTYPSIEDAIIAEADAVPEGFAYFANVTYGGASSGTISLTALPSRAAQVADQLVAIVAEMHAIG